MARPLRLEFAGALYHVTSRGNRREMIYESDDDRCAWLSILDEVCETFNWVMPRLLFDGQSLPPADCVKRGQVFN